MTGSPDRPSVRVALAQLDLCVGDLAGNVDKMVDAWQQAEAAGADLLLLPELAVTGYPPEDLLLRPGFVDDSHAAVADLAARTVGRCATVVGWVEGHRHTGADPHDGLDGPWNSAAVLHGGRMLLSYRKQALPNYGPFDEKRYFDAGAPSQPLLRVNGATVALSVCEDVWVDDGPVAASVRAGASLVVNLSASPYHLGKGRQRDELIGAFAADEGCAVAYANLVGGQDELLFDGRSLVFDAAGGLVARGAFCAEDLVVCDLDLPSGRGAGAIAIAAEIPVGEPGPPVAAEVAPLPSSELEELWGPPLGSASAVELTGVCTDSRRLRPGDLFVPLVGETFDGHGFLERVLAPAAGERCSSRRIASASIFSQSGTLLSTASTSTGRLDCWSTFCVCEPIRSPRSPLRP